MEQTLEINQQNAITAYEKAGAEGKALLENLFGRERLSRDIKDRVKSFEDACAIEGIDPDEAINGEDEPDEVAYKKLKIIISVLNEGWVADYKDGDQWKYYPVFVWSPAVGRLVFYDFDYTGTDSRLGARLLFKNADLATYAAKQFEDLYNDLLN